MRVNRRFLFWGVLLVAIGAVLVAADLRIVDTRVLADVLRLWPLAIVAVGLFLVLRRTTLGLPALLVAAAIPGLVLGSAFGIGPRFAGECGGRDASVAASTTQGTFEGPAVVAVRSACGSLNVTTAAGDGWQLDAGNTAGRTPTVDASARSLSIDATDDPRVNVFDGRDAWDLTLPTSALESLSLVVTAGHGQVALADADVGRLALTVNAAAMVVDASAASLDELAAVVNLGSLALVLPGSSDLTGSLRVGAGHIRICAPPSLGLRVTSRGVGEGITVNGLRQTGSVWQNADYAAATHHADLNVSATFGAVDINPEGGCS